MMANTTHLSWSQNLNFLHMALMIVIVVSDVSSGTVVYKSGE
jgi:hypothetical protein